MEEIRNRVLQAIANLFGTEIADTLNIEVTLAPENANADYASNIALKLSGILKAQGITKPDESAYSPREIATSLKQEITNTTTSFPFDIEIAGPGFLNFISRDEYWKHKLAELTTNFAENISLDDYGGQTIICEFSDPNPFKVLHVGHLYTSIMGDSISKLIENAGGKVIRANFGGDVGLHVAKTIYALQKNGVSTKDLRPRDDNGDETISPAEIAKRVEIIAKNYVEGTRAYEDDDQAKAEITELNKSIYAIAENDIRDTDLADLYWTGRELSYRYFDDFYTRLGVKFDRYYPESTVARRGLAEVQAHTQTVYEESDGAIIFVGERYGLHTRVFINKEGLPTYEAKDVGLLFTKWDDYHFDKSVVITGNDIIEYMKVVLKSVSLYAPELSERTLHITHGNVKLPGNEKMSSRKGNFIKAVDVLNAVFALVPDEKVAMGAIKYALLKYKIGGDFDFDIKESVSTTGNSGVYLQYSAVRAKKILSGNFEIPSPAEHDSHYAQQEKSAHSSQESAQSDNFQSSQDDNWVLQPAEKELIKQLAQYQDVLREATTELAPHKIANYLFDLAQNFSRFYEKIKVNGSNFELERRNIVKGYLNVMEHGLGLLGISIPEEM